MNPLPDHRSSNLMGYSTMQGGYPNGQCAVLPPPSALPQQQGSFLPYQGGPVYASPAPHPLPTAYPTDYSSQPVDGIWYNSGKYGKWMDEQGDSHKYTQLMFATMVTLIISLSMASLIIWLLFGVDVPVFEVVSLAVSNLSVSGSVIQATWICNITITNLNPRIRERNDSLKASILHDDYPLAMAAIHPSYTLAVEEGMNQVNVFFRMENETSISKDDLAKEVAEGKKAGVLILDLKVAAGSNDDSHDGWSPDSLSIICEGLKLLISPNGEGELAKESTRICDIINTT